MSELENILKAGEQAAPAAIGVIRMLKGFFRSKQETKPEGKPDAKADAEQDTALIFDGRDIAIVCLTVAVICLAVTILVQSAKSPMIIRL
jgi:hypothetical protein